MVQTPLVRAIDLLWICYGYTLLYNGVSANILVVSRRCGFAVSFQFVVQLVVDLLYRKFEPMGFVAALERLVYGM